MTRRKKPDGPDCRWSVDNDGLWEGDCGIAWQFTDGGPRENEVHFCPRCGRKLKQERTR